MRFLFVRGHQRAEDRVVLDGAQSHYLRRVLRLRPGAEVVLVDEERGERLTACVEGGRGREAVLRVVAAEPVAAAPEPAVALFQALVKGEHQEVSLRMAVELGAARIQPLVTHRSVRRLDAAAWEGRRRRWEGIVRGACQQCGRPRLPRLDGPLSVEEALETMPAGSTAFLFTEQAGADCAAASLPAIGPGGATVWIGPEGGFTEAEAAACRARGAVTVHLAEAILRSDTAVAAALVLVLARAGRL